MKSKLIWDESSVEVGDTFYYTSLGVSEQIWKVVDRTSCYVVMTSTSPDSPDISVVKHTLEFLIRNYSYYGESK